MSDSSGDCFYLSLVDAKKAVGVKVNLFAVVHNVEPPIKSKGTDYYVKVKVIEPSSETEISVLYFAKETFQLPRVRCPGDIISLHRVEMRIDKGDCYCVHHKSLSSSAFFDGKALHRFYPYQTFGKYKPSGYEKKYLLRIRPWSKENYSIFSTSQLHQQLRRINTVQNFDLVCKVLHVSSDSSCRNWVLYIWDGTDTPPASFQTDLRSEGEAPLPLHLGPSFFPRDVLITFPPIGTVLQVTAVKSLEVIKNLCAGQWVEILNLRFEQRSGLWTGVLDHLGVIHFLSDEDEVVKYRTRNYEERISCKVQRRPLTSFPEPSHIIEIDYSEAAYATLRESLAHKMVNHKFKSIVRVVAVYPWSSDQFCVPKALNPLAFRLTLEDPTARIHAYVQGDGAFKFFAGDAASRELISKNMKKLLGFSEVEETSSVFFRNPPWVWCCLKSYYIDKQDPFGSRRYMIFATTLNG